MTGLDEHAANVRAGIISATTVALRTAVNLRRRRRYG